MYNLLLANLAISVLLIFINWFCAYIVYLLGIIYLVCYFGIFYFLKSLFDAPLHEQSKRWNQYVTNV